MKNKILIPLLVVGIFAAFFSFKYSKADSRSSQDKRKLVLETVMKAMQGGHFSPRNIDDTFSTRVYTKCVTQFDPEKLFFTRQDVAMLKRYEFQIDDQIKANSLEFFDSLDAVIVRRVAGTEKYYKDILSKPFTFTSDDELQLNSAKKDYAANEADQTARWRDYIKYRVLAKYVDLKKEQDKKKENKDSVNAKMKTDAEMEALAREDINKFYQRLFKRYFKWKDDDRFTAYVNAITEAEDPHTSYFPPVEKKGFDEMMSGSFVGIGAVLKPDNDKTLVSAIVTGSPAWKQGELKADDEIQKVAQGDKPPVDIAGFELDDVVKIIRGPKGTEVRLTVKKPDGSVKVIPIIRGVVEREETFAKSAILKSKDGPIGYIYLPEFYADFNHTSGRSCAADVAKEVKKLKEAGVKGMILDLRENGGGSLGDVVDMAGIFIGKGPVVQVKSNHAAPSVLRTDAGSDSAVYNGPLAIMVNQSSASASEILAAVLQDYKRAVIVGGLTYGKGTVQKMFDLDQMIDPMTRLQMLNDTDGAQGTSIGSVKLTMEKFYRVNGGSTQLKGVTPDIALPDRFEGFDDDEFGERNNKSALEWDEIQPASYKTTNSVGNLKQLARFSESRIKADPFFKLIEESSEEQKKKKDDNRISLNEVKYKKEQEELNAKSKKMEDLQKNAVLLEATNPTADLARINMDSTSINKNKDWLKALGKDHYIAETVNIVNDLPKGGMTVNMGTGMK